MSGILRGSPFIFGAATYSLPQSGNSTTSEAGTELSTRFQSMEHLTDLDTAGNELFASSFNMGNDQVETLGRARRGRRYLRAELDRAPRAGRRELGDPESVVEWEICIEPPPKLV